MNQSVKKLIKLVPFVRTLNGLRLKRKSRQLERKEVAEWMRKGKPDPPPHVIKQQVLRTYAKQFGLRVFVETGTYLGDMVEGLKRDFDEIYTIELGQDLYQSAKERFASDRNVKLIHGDSGAKIKEVLKELDRPALFWLDGHFSDGITARGDKETPIWDELDQVLSAPDLGHVIVIDDARMFGSDPNYPTISEVKEFVNSKRPSNISVEYDSIRIIPAHRTTNR